MSKFRLELLKKPKISYPCIYLLNCLCSSYNNNPLCSQGPRTKYVDPGQMVVIIPLLPPPISIVSIIAGMTKYSKKKNRLKVGAVTGTF